MKGGRIIIETGACELNNFYTYVTGFYHSALTGETANVAAYVVNNPSADTFDNSDYYYEAEVSDETQPGYIFK